MVPKDSDMLPMGLAILHENLVMLPKSIVVGKICRKFDGKARMKLDIKSEIKWVLLA